MYGRHAHAIYGRCALPFMGSAHLIDDSKVSGGLCQHVGHIHAVAAGPAAQCAEDAAMMVPAPAALLVAVRERCIALRSRRVARTVASGHTARERADERLDGHSATVVVLGRVFPPPIQCPFHPPRRLDGRRRERRLC